jgi:hypothetical protein
MQTTRVGSIVKPGEGRQLPGIIFKITAEQAADSFSIIEHPYQPGVLIPPHVHDAADQVTCVIEGQVGTRCTSARSGSSGTSTSNPCWSRSRPT